LTAQSRPGHADADAHCRAPAGRRRCQVRHDGGVCQCASACPVGPLHALSLRCSNQYESTYHTCRSWRSFNYDDFVCDLRQSTLVCSPPDDVTRLIATYDNTLKSLIDVHAPYGRVRRSTRPSQYWFDAECRASKRTTRSLERIYRRRPSVETLSVLSGRTSLPHSGVCFTRRHPTTGLQRLQTARVMHGSCRTRSTELSSRQLHLRLYTVRMTWQLTSTRFVPITASARPSCVTDRLSTALSTFQLVTAEDVHRLITRLPCKH